MYQVTGHLYHLQWQWATIKKIENASKEKSADKLRGYPRVKDMLNAEFRESAEDFHHCIIDFEHSFQCCDDLQVQKYANY